MKPEEEKAAQAAPAAEAPHSATRKNAVLRYIAILFAAAFVLLLLSYLMQQRRIAEAMTELKGSVSAMETIESMRKTNEELRAAQETIESENESLRTQAEDAAAENARLAREAEDAAQGREAAELLWQLSQAYSARKYALCREILEKLEPLSARLSEEAALWTRSPAEEYARIVKALD